MKKKLKELIGRAKRIKIPLGGQDVCIIAGAVMVFYGLHLVFPPAAFIVIGCGLIYLGFPGR